MTGKNETIVDRVVMRLRAQPLGDLITEEDLHDIVKEAIPRAFFEKSYETDRWGSRKEKDAVIVELMRDLLKDKAREAVAAWMIDHRAEMLTYWKTVMDASLRTYVEGLQAAEVRTHVLEVLRPWLDKLNQDRMNQGLPMVSL